MIVDSTANTQSPRVTVVGAGLAGSECAWQLAELGFQVLLVEMRGVKSTPAHKTDKMAELVCSNSFGSQTDYSAPGQLKWEAEKLGSLILKSARECAIPAGMALGVDREVFSKNITLALESHPNIQIERWVIDSLDQVERPAVIATGPLTDEPFALSIRDHLSYGEVENDFLYFFDAIAPIIDVDSINMDVVWRGDRYDKGQGDYLNCPFTKEQYFAFIDAIVKAKKTEPKDFEKTPYFDGCMPIEAIVERGPQTLRYGPMSPNGLRNPKTGVSPYAVLQLRQENRECTSYNMVGFQTKMAYGDQKEVFRQAPGLENAEFLKLGSIHRNMYIHSPRKLSPILSSKRDPNLFFAGQITGVEGYFESTCIGLLVAHFVKQKLLNLPHITPPRESALGSLLNAITEPKEHFQPTNINFGLFPKPVSPDQKRIPKDEKRLMQLNAAKLAFMNHLDLISN